MQQQIKTFHGQVESVEQEMNDYIASMNNQGWYLSNISCFFSRQSNYILVFEKKDDCVEKDYYYENEEKTDGIKSKE